MYSMGLAVDLIQSSCLTHTLKFIDFHLIIVNRSISVILLPLLLLLLELPAGREERWVLLGFDRQVPI